MKTPVSTRIEANLGRIARTADIHDLARLVFPAKNATSLRAAFILIFISIKHARDKRLTTDELERERKEVAPEVSQKTLWKARAVMNRLGLIERRDRLYWRLSSRFSKSLHKLCEIMTCLMACEAMERDIWRKDNFFLDIALAEARNGGHRRQSISSSKPSPSNEEK